MLFGGFFDGAIFVNSARDVIAELGHDFHGPIGFATHAVQTLPFWLMLGGVVSAAYIYLKNPGFANKCATVFAWPKKLFDNKYYLDDLNEKILAKGTRSVGQFFWKTGDEKIIDGVLVNGSAKAVGYLATVVRKLQTGYLYHYAFAMIIGLALVLGWYIAPGLSGV